MKTTLKYKYMEDKNKVFVFDKKEVVLIFIFMVVLTTISFTLGIRFGKKISLKNDGIFPTDQQEIEIRSVKEEYVDDLVETTKTDEPEKNIEVDEESSNEEMISKLKEEFENLEKKSYKTTIEPVLEEAVNVDSAKEVNATETENISEKMVTTSELLKGKFTIQVGSYNSRDDAMKFAEAFSAMGYQPILHEVNIKNKGTWHRVSIGAFNNMAEAKEFLEKEKSVFAEKDYFIAEIK